MKPQPPRIRLNLRAYIFVGFALVAALSAILLLWINERTIRNQVRQEIGHRSYTVAQSAADSIVLLLLPALDELNELTASVDDSKFIDQLTPLLSVKVESHSYFESLLILDGEGYSILAYPKNPAYLGHSFSASELFTYPRLYGKPFFTDSFLSFQTQHPTTAVSMAAKSGPVVVGNLNLERVSELIGNTSRELGAVVRVVDGRGIVLASSDPKEALERTSFRDVMDAAADSNALDSEGFRYTREKKWFTAFFRPIEGTPWSTLVAFPQEDIDALPSFIRSRVLLVGTISLVLAFLIAFLLSYEIRRPLNELSASIRGISQAAYPVGTQSRSPFAEMDELLQEFSNMRTEVCLREEELKGALASRETLLKEVHHRVKNNLQIVSSLLALQRDRIENPEAYMVLLESSQRVHSLSLVHEKLYQSSDFSTLDLGEYLKDLSQEIVTAFDTSQDFDFSIDGETVETNIDIAIPIGLCVNEILSNSIKYGQKEDGEKGTIRLRLQKEGEGFLLVLSDDGPGFDTESARQSGSLGLLLIESLVAQVKGAIHTDTREGARFEIRVPQALFRS